MYVTGISWGHLNRWTTWVYRDNCITHIVKDTQMHTHKIHHCARSCHSTTGDTYRSRTRNTHTLHDAYKTNHPKTYITVYIHKYIQIQMHYYSPGPHILCQTSNCSLYRADRYNAQVGMWTCICDCFDCWLMTVACGLILQLTIASLSNNICSHTVCLSVSFCLTICLPDVCLLDLLSA